MLTASSLPLSFMKGQNMRIFKQAGKGKNTAKPRKNNKLTSAEKKLAKRQASYDTLSIAARKGKRRPGSLKKG